MIKPCSDPPTSAKYRSQVRTPPYIPGAGISPGLTNVPRNRNERHPANGPLTRCHPRWQGVALN
jgi:hypothetical protein